MTLEHYAWPGGYEHRFIFEHMRETIVICYDCAIKVDVSKDEYEDYRFIEPMIHWEGESMWCDDCGIEMESEYGVPD
jgi:hypothetical protein